MNIGRPLEGIPQTLLWVIFGVFCLVLGTYLINLNGFQSEISLSTSWTFLGIFIVLLGLSLIILNIAFWIIKAQNLLSK